MEEDLDDIARGERESVPWLRQFYFGNGQVGLRTMVEERAPTIDARSINTIALGVDSSGQEIVVRVGRFGPYLSRGEATAPVPDGIAPDELTPEVAVGLLERGPEEGRTLGTDPAAGAGPLRSPWPSSEPTPRAAPRSACWPAATDPTSRTARPTPRSPRAAIRPPSPWRKRWPCSGPGPRPVRPSRNAGAGLRGRKAASGALKVPGHFGRRL